MWWTGVKGLKSGPFTRERSAMATKKRTTAACRCCVGCRCGVCLQSGLSVSPASSYLSKRFTVCLSIHQRFDSSLLDTRTFGCLQIFRVRQAQQRQAP